MSDRQYRGGVHVEESGVPGSPAIVFIHGAGQSSRVWRQHMERLSDFHCLAPDLPGFGRSNHLGSATKERVADLLARLIEERVPAKRASVVGISSGGLHIHALLDRHPERVERAVIDGSPPFGTPRIGRAVMRLSMLAMAPFIRTRPFMAFFRDTHAPEDLRVASRLEFGRVVGECFGQFAALDAPSPALLIAGENERIVRSMNAALAEVLPRAQAWYVPGLGHCWQKADPDLHIRTVEAWVGGQELPSELRPEAAPSPAKVEQVRRMGPGLWYVRHKGRLMRLVRFYFRPFRKPLAEAYGKQVGEAIARDALARFEILLPDIPYIGGGQNAFTITLVKVAAKLAMYRALRAQGASVEGAARLVHLGEVAFYRSVPTRWLMRLQGRGFLSQRGIDTWRRIAAASQERRYAGDWVYQIVDGDGDDSTMALDCIECGAMKYLDREGAPELAPFLCWIDYPQFAAMGLRLDRSETLAHGGQRCDFRVSRGEPVHVEPEFLHA
ncbi:MAG: alpha/beta fold hydrolase [Candidatus Limnocylindrales bacterium]